MQMRNDPMEVPVCDIVLVGGLSWTVQGSLKELTARIFSAQLTRSYMLEVETVPQAQRGMPIGVPMEMVIMVTQILCFCNERTVPSPGSNLISFQRVQDARNRRLASMNGGEAA